MPRTGARGSFRGFSSVWLAATWRAGWSTKAARVFFLDIILGIIGGGIGGEIFQAFGHPGVTGFNLWSILVAFFGGVIVLLVYHAVRGQPKKSG